MSLPLLHAGRTNPGLSAALDLRFALDKSLTAYRGPTPSFSRASTGSYFDGSGVLRYAALNLLTYSENFSDASWSKNSATVTNDSIVSPDGKTTADTLTETSASATHFVNKASSTSAGTIYTSSIYAKAGTRKYIDVTSVAQDGGIFRRFNNVFDLETGTWQSTASLNSPANTAYSITSVGNGWYRISSSILAYGSTHYLVVYLSNSANPTRDAANDVVYTGNGTGNLYIWGAQLEASSTVGTYCPTTTAANSAPRFDHTFNGTSWVSRGLLLEEQRTNQVPNSEAFSNWTAQSGSTVTDASVNGPKGSNTASIINEGNLSVDYKGIFQILGNSVAAVYSFSVFAKYNNLRYIAIQVYDGPTGYATSIFDLLNGSNTATTSSGNWSSVLASSTDCGNGWYRLSMQVTSSGAVTIVTAIRPANAGTGFSASYGAPAAYTGTNRTSYIFGAQLEQGAFPTSYIPTTSASVTRSADVCQITGSDFSGFWNGTEGSLVAEYDRLAAVDANFSAGYPRIATAVKTSDTSRAVTLFASQSPAGEAFFVQDGTVQAWFSAGSLASANAPTKLSAAYKANDFAASLNGASVATDTSGTIPSGIDRMDIGNEYGVTRFHNGHIARLRYYPTRLTNAKLQELST